MEVKGIGMLRVEDFGLLFAYEARCRASAGTDCSTAADDVRQGALTLHQREYIESLLFRTAVPGPMVTSH